MKNVIQGILTFQNTVRPSLLPMLRKLAKKAEPRVLFVSCMDSRVIPESYTGVNPGHMFVIRNAGNYVPHARLFGSVDQVLGHTYSEHAALELAVTNTGVKHIAVCGHSNCKAMEGLYKICSDSSKHEKDSALENWIKTHGQASMTKLDQLMIQDGKPIHLVFGAESDPDKIEAIIDKDNKLEPIDKLSQINVLQQLHNIKSYSFVRKHLKTKDLQLHAMWFDIGHGQMFLFSRQHKAFEPIDEDTLKKHVDIFK